MKIQELSQKGKPIPGRIREVSPEFWDKLKKAWGKRLRWIEVKEKPEPDKKVHKIKADEGK